MQFVIVRNPICRHKIRHRRFALGEGSRLIQNDGLDLVGKFETIGSFNQNAVFCSFSRSYHDRGRCC